MFSLAQRKQHGTTQGFAKVSAAEKPRRKLQENQQIQVVQRSLGGRI